MSSPDDWENSSLSLSRARQLDAACVRFEAAWAAHERPDLEAYLSGVPEADRTALLRELLALELVYRRRAGEVVRPEDYLSRFASHADVIASAFGEAASTGPEAPSSADDQADGEIDPTAAAPGGPAPRYRIVRPHAQGGLGEVHVAEDTELHRAVALKRIQPQHASRAANVQRFLREAEITARLEHPGIVPVYGLVRDADGQPAYAMRFVAGDTLKQAIARYHQAPDPLPFRQLLGHFVAACNAVAYAHSRGVIHRDLKPANILLGQFGETLVVDWGLAKVVGRLDPAKADAEGTLTTAEPTPGDATALGQAVGTPAYMAPEQAAGRWDVVGPAADVYGLGATLYHLLTGQAPFQGTDKFAVLAAVQRGAFPPPRQVKRDVPAALAAVCQKALALEPEDRYATAQALAADVERWLADQPLAAYREPWSTRLRRWGRRHPAVVSTAAGGVLLTLGFVTVLALLIAGQKRALAEANAREHAAAAHAQQTIEDMTSPAALQFLMRQKELPPEQRRFLEQAIAYYRQYAATAVPAAAERVRQARAYDRMGLLQKILGLYSEAEEAYGAAVRDWERLAAAQPQLPDYRHQLAQSLNNLGTLLRGLGKRSQAEAEFRRAIALQAQLAADFPAVPEYGQDLAKHYDNLGNLLADLGKGPEAEAQYRRALAIREKLAADFPTVPKCRQELAQSHTNLGILLASLGKEPEAEAAYSQAIALQEQLASNYPAVPEYRQELAGSHNSRGVLLRNLGKWAEAEAAFRRALNLFARLAADFPAVPEYRHNLATSHNNLAALLASQGKGLEAEAVSRQALALYAQLVAAFPGVPRYRQELAGSHNNLGGLLKDLGKGPEAEAQYRRALAIREKLAADFPGVPGYRQDLASSHYNLGNLLADLGKRPEAEAEYRQALALQEQLAAAFPRVPAYRQDLAKSHHNLGILLADLGKRPEAEAEYRQALALQEQLAADFPSVPAYRQDLAKHHNKLGNLLADLGKRPEAEAQYHRALDLRAQLAAAFPTVPEYRQDLAESHNNLGVLLNAMGKRPEAEAAYRWGLALQEKLAADFPRVSEYAVALGGGYCNYGHLLRARGEAAASLDWYAKACAALRPVLSQEPRLVTARLFLRNAHWGRAQALDYLGRHAEAAADWEQASALSDANASDRWFRLQRSASLARAGQHREATAAVEDVLRPGNADGDRLYGAACVYARATTQAAQEAAPNTSSLQAERYARRAIALLRQAVAKGYNNVVQMKKDPYLDSLRPRPDFQQLLAEMTSKAP
jgi:serine/threonine-protein kinase